MGDLKQLRHFDLSGNIIVGEIPRRLARLSHLEFLSLHHNKMHTSIWPKMFDGMSSLKVLHLSRNNFHGSVPASIASASALEEILLDQNAFVGGLPNLLHSSQLTALSVRDNLLVTFDPKTLTPSLRTLALANNRLKGTLEDSFARLPLLRSFDCSHNQLTGKLPPSLFELVELQVLNLADNGGLSGTIPPLAGLPTLQALLLWGNRLSGEVPWGSMVGLGELVEIHLGDNQLTGGVPDVTNLLPGIQQCHLQGNHFATGAWEYDVDNSAGVEVDNIEEDDERPWLREELNANTRRQPQVEL